MTRAGCIALFLLLGAGPAVANDFRSVSEAGAALYDAPSPRAKKLYAVARDYPVEALVTLDNWVKIRDHSGELAWIEKKALAEKRTVVVTAPVGQVRERPDEQSAETFRAENGVILEFIEASAPGWIRVRHHDGQSGYIRLTQIWGG